jgi:hypothetical protein
MESVNGASHFRTVWGQWAPLCCLLITCLSAVPHGGADRQPDRHADGLPHRGKHPKGGAGGTRALHTV